MWVLDISPHVWFPSLCLLWELDPLHRAAGSSGQCSEEAVLNWIYFQTDLSPTCTKGDHQLSVSALYFTFLSAACQEASCQTWVPLIPLRVQHLCVAELLISTVDWCPAPCRLGEQAAVIVGTCSVSEFSFWSNKSVWW